VTAMHQFQSAGWRDRIVLLFTPPPFDSDVRRFQQTRGNKPYGEWHETIWAHKAPGTPGERSPTVSDAGLVLVAPVSSDVFVWTADNSFKILHTHTRRMGSLEF